MTSVVGFRYLRLTALLVLSSALFIFAAGCGGDDSRDVIRIMYWGVNGGKEVVQRTTDEFEKAHPNYRVRAETAPYRGSIQGYEEKLIVLIGAKDPPDVAMLVSSRVPEYAKMGGLVNLDSFLSEKPNWLTAIDERKLREGDLNGSVYAVPSGYDGIAWVIPRGCGHKKLAWEMIGSLVKNGYKPFSRLSKTP